MIAMSRISFAGLFRWTLIEEIALDLTADARGFLLQATPPQLLRRVPRRRIESPVGVPSARSCRPHFRDGPGKDLLEAIPQYRATQATRSRLSPGRSCWGCV